MSEAAPEPSQTSGKSLVNLKSFIAYATHERESGILGEPRVNVRERNRLLPGGCLLPDSFWL